MVENLLHPTTDYDMIREIVIFAIGIVLRYFEKKKLKKKYE